MTTPQAARLRILSRIYVFVGFVFGFASIARGFEIANGNWHACPAASPASHCIANWRTLPSLYVGLGLFMVVASAWRLYAVSRSAGGRS